MYRKLNYKKQPLHKCKIVEQILYSVKSCWHFIQWIGNFERLTDFDLVDILMLYILKVQT